MKKNDLAAASGYFQQAVTLIPNDASAQMFLGYVLLKQEKYADALPALETANKLGGSLMPSRAPSSTIILAWCTGTRTSRRMP